MRRRSKLIVLIPVLGIAACLCAWGASEWLINRTGKTATGVEVEFDRAVRITDYEEDIFPNVDPAGRSETFVFDGGSAPSGRRFKIAWSPSSAEIVRFEWIVKPTASPATDPSTGLCTEARRDEANRLLDQGRDLRDGDPQAAMPVLKQALSIYEACGDHEGQADCLWSLGYCSRRLTETTETLRSSLQYYERALEEYATFGEPEGQASCNMAIGRICFLMAEYPRAIDAFEQAIRRYEALDELREVSLGWYRLGTCYYDLGDIAKCFECTESALHAAELGGFAAIQAVALAEMGGCLFVLGEVEHSAELFLQSNEIMATLGDAGDRIEWYGHVIEGWRRELHEQYTEAIEAYTQSLSVARTAGSPSDQLFSLSSIALCEVFLGRYEAAPQRLDEALLLARTYGYPRYEWWLLWWLGKAYEGLGDLRQARISLEAALQEVEAIRGRIELEDLKRSFLGTARGLYEDYLRILLQAGLARDTLLTAERCRARTLLDLLAAGPVDAAEYGIEDGIRSGAVNASAITRDLSQITESLPANTAALEYFVSSETTYVWSVRGGMVGCPIQIDMSSSMLRRQVLTLRMELEATSTGLTSLPSENMYALSRDLYELLIAPIEDQLEGVEHLVIVPSGPLYYLPFCALLDCPNCEGVEFLGGEHLIERFSLSYAPSLTTLKYAWTTADTAQVDSLFLALADPATGEARMLRLPDAQREAESVAMLFDPSEVYVDRAATEDILAARSEEAGRILLSTHGSFNPANPMFSYLLLSPTEKNDGRLYTHEIFGLDLHTDLVTLSACETLLPALQDMEDDVRSVRGIPAGEDVELTEELLASLTAGDEIVGLTRAFLYAGTPSVLSSLWQVVSETTEPLMVAFHGYLQSGLDKAEALRQAQLDTMAMYPHPRYLAAFELVGDWR